MTVIVAQPKIIPIVYRFAYNTTDIASGVKIGDLPIGCYMMGYDVFVDTAFNAGATATFSSGFNAAGIEYAFGQDLKVAGKFSPTRWSGTVTWPLAAAREVWVKYAETGAAATAGVARIVVWAMKNTL